MAALKSDQKYELARLIAQRKTYAYIIQHFKDQYGITVFDSQIVWYKNVSEKWRAIIKEMRKAWEKELSEEYLASKRIRLRELERARASAMEPAFAGYAKKSGGVKGEEGEESCTPIYKNSPGAAVAAIKAAQEEMEGTKVKHEINPSEELAKLLAEVSGLTRGLPKRSKPPSQEDSEE